MNLLTDFKAVLDSFDENVYYGTADLKKDNEWNYIVFQRDALRRKENRSGYADVINVLIVREEYIPDGLAEQLIEALDALPGVRPVEGDYEYYYGFNPNTKLVVESLKLQFVRARKL